MPKGLWVKGSNAIGIPYGSDNYLFWILLLFVKPPRTSIEMLDEPFELKIQKLDTQENNMDMLI